MINRSCRISVEISNWKLRKQSTLVAVTLAYLWIMEAGASVVIRDQWCQVDKRGAERTVSLYQTGLRWLSKSLNEGFLPHLFTGIFKPLEAS